MTAFRLTMPSPCISDLALRVCDILSCVVAVRLGLNLLFCSLELSLMQLLDMPWDALRLQLFVTKLALDQLYFRILACICIVIVVF